MAQPNPYVPSYDFTDFQTGSPTTPLPGDRLDTELGAVQLSIGQVLTNLAIIQRADTMLANGTVHWDALSSSVRALLGGWTVRGLWATATAYAVGDLVSESGGSYVCAVAHTSGTFATDLAASNWLTVMSPLVTNPQAANILDWDGADPTGNNDNSSYFAAALAQSKAVEFPAGRWVMDNSSAFEIEDGHVIYGVSGLTSADFNLTESGGSRLIMTGTASSGFVNADAATALLHAQVRNLEFYATGSYTKLFDLTEPVGCDFQALDVYTTQSTMNLFTSAKLVSTNSSWVNRFLHTRWRVPDAATVRVLDADFSDSAILMSSFTGGRGTILRGTGGMRVVGNRFDRAKTAYAGLTISVETASLN